MITIAILKYKEVRDGYIVYRKDTEKHTHFKSKNGARKFLYLMNKNLLPQSPYFVESARRLLTEEEFNKLKTRRKQKYCNVNRGVKHA